MRLLGIGAYVAAILGKRMSTDLAVDLAAGMVISLAIALIVGIPALRLARTSFVMVTLALFLVLYVISNNWDDLTNGPMGISAIQPARIDLPGGQSFLFNDRVRNYYLFFAYAIFTLWTVMRIIQSRIGRVLLAIREDEILAQSFGVDLLRYKLIAFVVSSTLPGLGALYAALLTYVGNNL
jgi:branched-chain amino acid transport system permease protein